MDHTQFAGLTRLAPGDSLSEDGYSFQNRNPEVIDHFLRLIVTHRHDAHPALANPTTDPAVATNDTGGQIPADTDIFVAYTLIDSDGGETLPNPTVQQVTTVAGLADPTGVPVAVADSAAGSLMANSYAYAITVTDGMGGESVLSPAATVNVPPAANGEVVISGLSSIVAGSGGVGWRLWRQSGGGDWALYATGLAATDGITDNGTLPCDCGVSPPTVTGSSRATSQLSVTVPGGQPADAVQFAIYASLDGTFADPALLGVYPIADAGTEKLYNLLAFLPGAPPPVATTVPGSALISDDDTGGGGGGGSTGPLPIIPAWYMTKPELTGNAPDSTNGIVWEDNGVPVTVLYSQVQVANDVYAFEAYNGALDTSLLAGDTTHVHLNGSGDVSLVDAGDWHVAVAPTTTKWLEMSQGGYTEFDYHIANDNWANISADIWSLGTAGAGVRAIIDRVAGTFSLINIATGAVLASVGAADGYTPPPSGTNGSIILALHKSRVVATDSQNGAANAGILDVTVDTSTIPISQSRGGWGIDATDVTAVIAEYWSFSTAALTRAILLGLYSDAGNTLDSSQVVWTEDTGGGGLRAGDWQFLSDGSVASPHPAENGWTNPVTAGSPDWLGWRIVEGAAELQIRGKLDGTAATGAVFATLPSTVTVAGDTEHPAILVASDGTRSTCYIKVGADRTLSLVQPAFPLPAGSILTFGVSVAA